MKPGDLVRYWFARKYPVFGVVTEKYSYEADHPVQPGTYLYSVVILVDGGSKEIFDIHEGDKWEVIGVSH